MGSDGDIWNYIVNVGFDETPVEEEEEELGYLTFTAEEAGSTVTFQYLSGSAEYSTDGGNTWNACTSSPITLANVGDKVLYRGWGVKTDVSNHFSMTGKIAASGSVTSLTDGEGMNPNVTLTDGCYYGMFFACASLTKSPALPATKLANSCYAYMFAGCSSLTKAPKLPSKALANLCYMGMFAGCTKLTTAPVLPATKLADSCYSYMFQQCISLTTSPALPATELKKDCYGNMFSECTALTTPPALPATELAYQCYANMFYNCTSLWVSGTQTASASITWKIPSSGTFTNTIQYNQGNMFGNCLGTRSSDAMTGAQNDSHTYYTQNIPVE